MYAQGSVGYAQPTAGSYLPSAGVGYGAPRVRRASGSAERARLGVEGARHDAGVGGRGGEDAVLFSSSEAPCGSQEVVWGWASAVLLLCVWLFGAR
jgi:hypothetical protein